MPQCYRSVLLRDRLACDTSLVTHKHGTGRVGSSGGLAQDLTLFFLVGFAMAGAEEPLWLEPRSPVSKGGRSLPSTVAI